MHGHSFWVLKIGLPPIDSQTGFVDCYSEDIECFRSPGVSRCGYVQGNTPGGPDDYVCTSTSWASGKEYKYPNTATGKIDPRTPRKDTIMAPAGGYAVIAMVADNPGVWFMHCHVENHAVEGMGVVLNEARPNQNPSPEEMRPHTWQASAACRTLHSLAFCCILLDSLAQLRFAYSCIYTAVVSLCPCGLYRPHEP